MWRMRQWLTKRLFCPLSFLVVPHLLLPWRQIFLCSIQYHFTRYMFIEYWVAWLYFIYCEVLLFYNLNQSEQGKLIKIQIIFFVWLLVITSKYRSVLSIISLLDQFILQRQFWKYSQTTAELLGLTVYDVKAFLLFFVYFKPIKLRWLHQGLSIIRQVGLNISGCVIIKLLWILPFHRLFNYWCVSGMVFRLNSVSKIHRVLSGTDLWK